MTILISRSDWEKFETTLRAGVAVPFLGPWSLTSGVAAVEVSMVAGVRIQPSDLVRPGSAVLIEPGRPPRPIAVADVLRFVTAQGLAAVDEEVGA